MSSVDVSGQYALSAILVNSAAFSHRSPGLELWIAMTTFTILMLLVFAIVHTDLPAATALPGSSKVIPADPSAARNWSSVLSACAGTARPIMAARPASIRRNLIPSDAPRVAISSHRVRQTELLKANEAVRGRTPRGSNPLDADFSPGAAFDPEEFQGRICQYRNMTRKAQGIRHTNRGFWRPARLLPLLAGAALIAAGLISGITPPHHRAAPPHVLPAPAAPTMTCTTTITRTPPPPPRSGVYCCRGSILVRR
jgi:hypothetical protein